MKVGFIRFHNQSIPVPTGICRVTDSGFNNRWLGWVIDRICSYVAVDGNANEPKSTNDFEIAQISGNICWDPQDSLYNGWSPNLVVPGYVLSSFSLSGVCRGFLPPVSDASSGVVSGHLLITIGLPPQCWVAYRGKTYLLSQFEAGEAC